MAIRAMEVKILFQETDPIGKLMDLLNDGHTIGGIGLHQTHDGRAKLAKQLRQQAAAGQLPPGLTIEDETRQIAPPRGKQKNPYQSAKGDRIRASMMEILYKGSLSMKGMAEKAGQKLFTTSYHMASMIKAGNVERLPDTTYALTAAGRDKVKSGGNAAKPSSDTSPQKPTALAKTGRRISRAHAALIRLKMLQQLVLGPLSVTRLAEKIGEEADAVKWQRTKMSRLGLIKTGGEDGLQITKAGEKSLIGGSSAPALNAAE